MRREQSSRARRENDNTRLKKDHALGPLEQRIAKAAPRLNASRRRLVQTILDKSDDTYFLSSRKLAQVCGVDVATIVRTVQALGYERYEDFSSDLRAHFVLNIQPYTAMKVAVRQHRGIADHIQFTKETDLRNLNALYAQLDVRRVVELAKKMEHSRRVLVVGVDLAAPLAQLLAYRLAAIGYDAEAPVGSLGNLTQKTNLLGPRDLLVAISFGRCLRQTVDAALHARERGIPTLALTDSERTPLARFCDSHLIAPTASPALFSSYVAPVSAINLLIVVCTHLRTKRALQLMKQKEEEYKTGTRWYSSDGEFNKT